MSIKLMAEVWELNLPKHEILILLALTDHAADDGTQVYPSIARIAWKTGYSIRRIQDVMKDFRDRGILQELGRSKLNTKHYRVDLRSLPDKESFKDFNAAVKAKKVEERQARGVQSSTNGVQLPTSGVQPSTSRGAVGITRTISNKHQSLFIRDDTSVDILPEKLGDSEKGKALPAPDDPADDPADVPPDTSSLSGANGHTHDIPRSSNGLTLSESVRQRVNDPRLEEYEEESYAYGR